MALNNLFTNLVHRKDGVRSARVSSWDQSGRNQDYWMIPERDSVVLADLCGPGCITHIWMTSFCRIYEGPGIMDPLDNAKVAPVNEIHNALGLNRENTDPNYFRKAYLKMTWDDSSGPSVLVPLGDFFGIGHSMPSNFTSLPLNVSVKPSEDRHFGAQCSCSCYFPMPFNKKAKIEIVNENERPLGLYFYIDYELYKQNLADDTVFFHAAWHREFPCNGWGNDLQVNSPEVNSVPNLGGEENFVVLEAKGSGHYVGCNLSVTHFQGSWWGEGDDMIFIDGEKYPSLIGTGTEDYFNHAWGMQKNQFLFFGSILHESDFAGYQVSYRFHIADPIYFSKSIKVTIEHGHANHLSDDWCATAYWYQTLPCTPLSILNVEKRLPLIPQIPECVQKTTPQLTSEMKAAIDSMEKRNDVYMPKKMQALSEKKTRTKEYEKREIVFSHNIKQRFDKGE
jgi:hypothetical protein